VSGTSTDYSPISFVTGNSAPNNPTVTGTTIGSAIFSSVGSSDDQIVGLSSQEADKPKGGSPLSQAPKIPSKIGNLLGYDGLEIISPRPLSLKKGFVLFAPTKDIVVQTHLAKVYITAGSVAYVVETGENVAIYNLHDRAKRSVLLAVSHKDLSIAPGMEIVLTKSRNASFAEVDPAPKIGHRSWRCHDLGEGIIAHIAEFSMVGALGSEPVLRDLKNSYNPEYRQLASQIIKDAGILLTLNRKAEPYKARSAEELAGTRNYLR